MNTGIKRLRTKWAYVAKDEKSKRKGRAIFHLAIICTMDDCPDTAIYLVRLLFPIDLRIRITCYNQIARLHS
jgi:hypothetical protein